MPALQIQNYQQARLWRQERAEEGPWYRGDGDLGQVSQSMGSLEQQHGEGGERKYQEQVPWINSPVVSYTETVLSKRRGLRVSKAAVSSTGSCHAAELEFSRASLSSNLLCTGP